MSVGESLDRDHPEAHDVADDDAPALPGRRRPAGQAPYPFALQPSGWAWLGLAAIPIAVWLWTLSTGRFPPGVDAFDRGALRMLIAGRSGSLTTVARVVAALGSVPAILVLRWGTILVLAVFRRGRHLVAFVAVVLATRLGVIELDLAIGRPRPWGTGYLTGWNGYAHPSAPVAAVAAAGVAAVLCLVPAERRRWAWIATAAAIAGLVLARAYLGVDHPSDGLLGALMATSVALVALRIYCPDDIFPVVYERRKGAHLGLDGERGERLRHALEEQVDLRAESIEPFGLEGSGGSTPLKVRGRSLDEEGHPGEPVTLFGKLYSASHLRADRWNKLWRTILYGALEDEVAFNSVRQLVEYEDYMLRVMNDAGVPTVEPRGIVEVIADREYLVLMTFLRDADEADEASAIDASVIDRGMELVQTLWRSGLAHRDIKPANVLVKDGRVHLIDVAFGQIRASAWRQAVDLANMMLVLSLGSDAETVLKVARRRFTRDELAEAFAATRGVTMPRELRAKLREDGRDLLGRFRRLVTEHEPIRVQRWSVGRVALTVRTGVFVLALGALVLINLANPSSP